MTVKFTGDFAKLNRWVRDLNATPELLPVITQNMAEESIDLIKRGFADQTDPYGRKWASKAIGDGRAVLTGNTARLRNGWHVKSVGKDGFTVSPSVGYARYHQQGTGVHGPRKQPIKPRKAKALSWQVGGTRYFSKSVKGAPVRKMVPDGGRLPPLWRRHLVLTAREVLEAHFTR